MRHRMMRLHMSLQQVLYSKRVIAGWHGASIRAVRSGRARHGAGGQQRAARAARRGAGVARAHVRRAFCLRAECASARAA